MIIVLETFDGRLVRMKDHLKIVTCLFTKFSKWILHDGADENCVGDNEW